jgi:septal ring factor EnvC (AmiA/AmiB activator)
MAHRDLWASFFKATSWEELRMLAQQDTNIAKAVTTVHRLSEDEEFRMQYEAREDRIRQQLDHDYWYDTEIKKHKAVIQDQQTALAEKDTTIFEQKATISEKDARIAELEKLLAEKS